MAENALKAKERAAQKLAKQLDALRQHGVNDKLLKRVGCCPATQHAAATTQHAAPATQHALLALELSGQSSSACATT